MKYKKGFLYVLFSNMIALIISLFSGFVLPKLLSIETYANIKLFQLYITYTGFLHLGFSDGMYLKFGGKDIENLKKQSIYEEYNTFCLMQFIISIIFVILSILMKNFVLFFFSLSIVPVNVTNYIQKIYQASGCFKKYAKISNLSNILNFAINIILIFIIKTDSSIIYIALYFIIYVFIWVLLVFQLKKMFGKNNKMISLKCMVEDIKEGFLLMIGNFCSIILTSIDRIFTKIFMGLVNFAYYSFAVSLENLINTFVSPIVVVMYNYLCEHTKEKEILSIKRIVLILSAVLIGSVYFAKMIVVYFIPKYEPSASILCILFLAQLYSIVVKSIHNNLYKVERKQKKYFFIMIKIILINLSLDLILYHIFKNMLSFAIATLITCIIWLILSEFNFDKAKLKTKDYIYLILVTIITYITYTYLNPILGVVAYFSILIVISIILMRDQCVYIYKEAIDTITKLIRK